MAGAFEEAADGQLLTVSAADAKFVPPPSKLITN